MVHKMKANTKYTTQYMLDTTIDKHTQYVIVYI
jgi:hypothetical protein